MFVNLQLFKKKIYCSKNKFKSSSICKLYEKKTEVINFSGKEKYIYFLIKIFSFETIRKCTIFIEHLLIRNKYTNLVSKQTLFILYKKHFLDSLTILSIFNSIWPKYNKRRSLDIGTGGGFPGFILSIIMPQLYFCLVDSIKKKIEFHSKISFFIELKNCYAVSVRAENLGRIKQHTNTYYFILARAVSDISILVELSISLLAKFGNLILMKKINKISEEIKNSLFIMRTNHIKLKASVITSNKCEGKIIIVLKKLNSEKK